MKYIFSFLFSALFFFLPASSLASATIHFSADKTTLSTDDTLTLRLSIDGEIDNGQVGITGLSDFDLVGQQSSQQVQIINGNTSVVQEKVLSLTPKKAGKFVLQAVAYENGEKITSDPLSLTVTKSLIQETKEKLLQESANVPEASQEQEDSSFQKTKNTDSLLRTPKGAVQQEKDTLVSAPPSSFPKVEHISPFNAFFWAEVFGIFVLLAMLIAGGIYIASFFQNKK